MIVTPKTLVPMKMTTTQVTKTITVMPTTVTKTELGTLLLACNKLIGMMGNIQDIIPLMEMLC